MLVEEGHHLSPPQDWHPYTDDSVLPGLLKRLLPEGIHAEIHNDLLRFGDTVRGPIQALAAQCDPPYPQPTLVQYDNYGRRVDVLTTSPGWEQLKAVAHAEGLVNIAYQGREKYGEHARLYQFAKITLFAPASRMIMCPMSMTDGCARVLESLKEARQHQKVYDRLTSRNPHEAFTAGQWMTERPGGSDLTMTETTAERAEHRDAEIAKEVGQGDAYELKGFKWFSSATDGEVALALARTGGPNSGARGLSLFLVPSRMPMPPSDQSGGIYGEAHAARKSGKTNGIRIHRLKNKIGTNALPTAELSLDGTLGVLIGQLNGGVKAITPVLNITRIHSCVGGVAALGKALRLAKSYACTRRITSGMTSGNDNPNGTLLRDMSLHTYTLARVEVTYRALAHLVFGAVHLLGKSEAGTASSAEQARLRIVTPVAKAYVAMYAVTSVEECMAAMGGQGYMEETGIGRMIRDMLVERVWEGTVNVLGLDVVRAISIGNGFQSIAEWSAPLIAAMPTRPHEARSVLQQCSTQLARHYSTKSTRDRRILARPALLLLGHFVGAVSLLEHALWMVRQDCGDTSDMVALQRWIEHGPTGAGLAEVSHDLSRTAERSDHEVLDNQLVYDRVSTTSRNATSKL